MKPYFSRSEMVETSKGYGSPSASYGLQDRAYGEENSLTGIIRAYQNRTTTIYGRQELPIFSYRSYR